MAEIVPPAADLVTKHDLARIDVRFSQLEAKVDASTKETMRYMLTFFIPVLAEFLKRFRDDRLSV